MPPNDFPPSPPQASGDRPPTSALPPGVSILTDEQMTVIVQQAARREMERLRDTVRADAAREVGGQIDEEIRAGVRREIGQTLDERIGAVKRTIQGKVRQEVHAQMHEIVQGWHITVNWGYASHIVLGGLIHASFPWLGKKVGGAFSEYVKGTKIERIMGAFYHNAPLAEHFHTNFLLKTAESIFKAPKFALAHAAELRLQSGKIKTKVQKLQAEGKKLDLQGDTVKHEVSKKSVEAAQVMEQADELTSEASTWDGAVSTFKSDEIEAKE